MRPIIIKGNLVGISRSIWKAPEFTLADNLKIKIYDEVLKMSYKLNDQVKKVYKYEFERDIVSVDYSKIENNEIVIALTLYNREYMVILIRHSGTRFYEGKLLWPWDGEKLLIAQSTGTVFINKGEITNYPRLPKFIEEENYVFIPYFLVVSLAKIPDNLDLKFRLEPLIPNLSPSEEGPHLQKLVKVHFKDKIVEWDMETLFLLDSEFINNQLDSDFENIYLPSFNEKDLSDFHGIIKFYDYIGSLRLPNVILNYYISVLFDVPLE